MKKKTVIVLIIIAILVGGYFGLQALEQNRANALAASFQTATVQRGDLTAIVGATGVVRSNQTALLTWQNTGTIGEVRVEMDDEVKTDQILAVLDSESLAQTVILAQADLVNARRNLDNLLNSQLSKAQAQSALANAAEALETAQKRRESKAYQRASDQVIEEAYANYILAKDEASKWEQRYDMVDDRPEDDPVRAAGLSEWAAAKQVLARAEANLRYLQSAPDEEEIAIAEANLALAQAQYDDALREWERLKDGPDPDDILAAQARIDSIQATINSIYLRAPFAATVTEIQSKPGDQVSPGVTSFRIDDLSKLLVDVQIPEVDINSVKMGMSARITFDGIQGKEYRGNVVEVARVGTSLNGVVNFKVTVELIDSDESVLPGMTAAVNVVVSEITNVLIVPNRAIRLREGVRVVYVLKPGQVLPEATTVSIGAISDLQSEIVSGVQEGDVIVLNPPTDLLSNSNSGMMGGSPF